MTELTVARTIFIVFFVLLLGGVYLLPRIYIFRGAPSTRRWRDLRLWALVLVVIHVAIYLAL
ncbi:MAG: hypothetical protein O7J95_01850 [Planctomycetota bacterium]|nr:hypothetical protein [Planctomycetota bacterium]